MIYQIILKHEAQFKQYLDDSYQIGNKNGDNHKIIVALTSNDRKSTKVDENNKTF